MTGRDQKNEFLRLHDGGIGRTIFTQYMVAKMKIRKGNSLTTFVFLLATLLSACGGGGGSSDPTDDEESRDTLLVVPTGVTATAGDGAVTVAWQAVAGATGYNIYGNKGAYVTSTNSSYYTMKLAGATSPYVVTGLTNGLEYSFVVTAVYSSGESGDSDIVVATPLGPLPAPVSGFNATPANHQVTLSWDAVPNATGYVIYYSTEPGVGSAQNEGVVHLLSAGTSYLFEDLPNGTTYYYSIVAENATGKSAPSVEVSATPNLQTGWNLPSAASGSLGVNLALGSLTMTSNRDILVSYHYETDYPEGSVVYANTYSKESDWGTQFRLSSNGFKPVSDLSENGDGVAVWQELSSYDEVNGIYTYVIKASHYQGGSWGSPITLSGTESDEHPSNPTVAIDSQGNAVAVWKSGAVYARTYDKANGVWSSAVQLGTSNPYDITPSIDVDGAGLFTIAWSQSSSVVASATETYARQFSKAGGWADAVALSSVPTVEYEGNGGAVTRASSSGDVFVAWKHAKNGTVELILKRYAAGAWSDAMIIDTSPYSINLRSIAADDDGNAVMHWDTTSDSSAWQVQRFVVYEAGAVNPVGPVLEMVAGGWDSVIDRVGLTAVTNGAPHMFYGYYDGEFLAAMYERVYDYATDTWSEPVMVHRYFYAYDYLAASNASGEMIVVGNNRSVMSSFYLPAP